MMRDYMAFSAECELTGQKREFLALNVIAMKLKVKVKDIIALLDRHKIIVTVTQIGYYVTDLEFDAVTEAIRVEMERRP